MAINRPGDGERFPLSPIQYGMLLHSVSAPGGGLSVLQKIISMRHGLDIAVFEQAVRELVTVRPTLRTGFCLDDPDGPSQSVLDDVDVVVHTHDLRHLDESAQQALMRQYLDEDRARPFDFAAGPPIRFAVFRFGAEKHELVWTSHHALLDGRSCAIVVAELYALYDAMMAGRPIELPSRPAYADYIRWLSEQDFTGAASFWRDNLAGVRVPTPFGFDTARKLGHGERAIGATATQLAEDMTARLYALAHDHKVTPNNFVQAAWAVLLRQVSGRDDVLFGTTRACRSFAANAKEMVGLFFNTLPLRVAVPDDTTVVGLLTRLRADQVALRGSEYSSQAQIREWSGIPARNALFDSIVVFENYQYDAYLRAFDPAWERRNARFEERTGYAFTVSAYRDVRLDLKLGYDRLRIEDDVARLVLTHLCTLLEAMVSAPETPLGRLPAFEVGSTDLEPLDVPRHGQTADTPAGYGDVTVPIPAELDGDLEQILAATLAFLARLAGANGCDIDLRRPSGRLPFRVPALSEGRGFAAFRQDVARELARPRALPVSSGLPVVIELVRTCARPCGHGEGPRSS